MESREANSFATSLPVSNIGIDEQDRGKENLFSAYPNPAHDNLTIEGPENSNWKIIDVLGRNIISGKLENQMNKINVESLSNGTYFIYLNHGSENQIYQIIISR